MRLSKEKAYRLGSMPRRVHQVRLHPRWPEEEPCRRLVDLVDEWLALFDEVQGSPLKPSVLTLKTAVEAEVHAHLSQIQAGKQQRVYEMLTAMGQNVQRPQLRRYQPPAKNSLELTRELSSYTETESRPTWLPHELRQAHELGQLVAECRYGRPDRIVTLRIARLVQTLTCDEWLTGSRGLTGQPIHETVMSRIDLLDDLLSTEPWPISKESPERPSATQIGQAVAQQLRPELAQLKSDIADYAELATADQQQPVPATEALLSIPIAMKQSGLSRRKLQALLGEGKIKFKLVGKRQMVIPQSLRAYLSSPDQEVHPPAERALPPVTNRQKIPDHLAQWRRRS